LDYLLTALSSDYGFLLVPENQNGWGKYVPKPPLALFLLRRTKLKDYYIPKSQNQLRAKEVCVEANNRLVHQELHGKPEVF